MECHKEKHRKCKRNYIGKQVESAFLVGKKLQFLEDNPNVKQDEIAKRVWQDLHVDVSKHQARRAKKIAKILIHKTREEQYSLLQSYVAELKKTN